MPTWNNVNSGLWTDSANWTGGVPNAIGAQADFVVLGGTGATIATFTENTMVSLGTLNITSTGARDVLFQGSLADSGSGVATLAFDGGITADSRINVTTAVGGGEFEISGFGGLRVSVSGLTEFNVVTAGTTARLNAPLIGNGQLVKMGAGTLQMGSSATTFGGTITVDGGVLTGINGGVFGTARIILSNNSTLLTTGTLSNQVGISKLDTGIDGGGKIMASSGTTLTLAGNFGHGGGGTLTLGNSVHNGTIALNFGATDNTGAGNGTIRLDSATIRLENAMSASNAFFGSNINLTELVGGAVLDTRGFLAVIQNLDLDNGTIRSSTGALNLRLWDDLASANSQNGTIEGTAGTDMLDMRITNDWSFAATTFTNWSANDTISFLASDNANTITGSTFKDIFSGRGGNDTLIGNGGADQFFGGDGDDLIVLNAQNDNSNVQGDNGTDTLRITGGTIGLNGMAGIEAVELQNNAHLQLSFGQLLTLVQATAAISGNGTISATMFNGQSLLLNNLAVAPGSNITFNITGTISNETIVIHPDAIGIVGASAGNDIVTGGNRGDTIVCAGGIDTVNAGAGNDLVEMWAQSNGSHIHGGADTDTLRISMGSVTLGTITGFEAIDIVAGTTLTMTHTQFAGGFAPNSAVSGSGTITINIDSTVGINSVLTKPLVVAGGSSITMNINGNTGTDVIKAANGVTNVINTGGGLNTVQGGNLGDTVTGGSGVDKIAGNGGVDTMTGGGGADVFKFRAITDAGVSAQADVITDFLAGTDRLNFGRIDADPNTAGDQAFQFMGTGAFAGNGTASIRWVDTGADLRVEVDVDGDFIADMHIMLMGAGNQTLSATDFVL